MKKGSIWTRIAAFLLVIILLGVIGGAIFVGVKSEGFKNWDYFKGEQTEQPEEEQPSGVTDGEGNALESGTAYAMPTAMVYSIPTAQSSASEGITITATVLPDTAINKNVTWTLSFADDQSEWATGKTVTDYVTVTPTSDGANTATLTCLKAFEGEALITVTTREGGYIDTCRVVFVGDPTSLAVSCEEATTASGSFGSYYELGVGNSYAFDLTPGNVFGFVGAECNYSYTVTGYGSFKVQQQKYSTSYGTRTWVEGTEKTVNIKDVTTVSKYEPSVFDWAIDGNKLNVTVNCTLDSYYTSSQRVGNTITYENKFREYTDDNWYYEVKVMETNSGVSHTFKVRPVKVVTNVVLGDDVITF